MPPSIGNIDYDPFGSAGYPEDFLAPEPLRMSPLAQQRARRAVAASFDLSNEVEPQSDMPPEPRSVQEIQADMDAVLRTDPRYGTDAYYEREDQYVALQSELRRAQRAAQLAAVRERERIGGPLLTCDVCNRQSYTNDDEHRLRSDGSRSPTCRSCVRARTAARRNLERHGRKFGVEIEFEALTEHEDLYGGTYTDRMDPDDIVAALQNAGINAYNAGYSHEITRGEWKLVSDSSVDTGWELVSPPLTWDQRDQIHTACQALEDLGATISEQCGLHVHHEVRDLSLAQFKRLVSTWAEVQPMTDTLVDPSRTNRCEWCSPFLRREVDRLLACENYMEFSNQMMNQDRYRSLNLTAFQSYGTVEVRQHEGTLDSNKILAWVQYGQTVIDAARSRRRPMREHVHTYLDALPFKCDQSREYLKSTARVARTAVLTGRI